MKEPRPILSIFILCLVAGLLLAIALPNFVRDPYTSPRNACINNLRLIDGAKEQWALEFKKSPGDVPTWEDMKLFLCDPHHPDLPKCPEGGTYTLGAVSNPLLCSVAGHVLP